jgi:hypothetical protein
MLHHAVGPFHIPHNEEKIKEKEAEDRKTYTQYGVRRPFAPVWRSGGRPEAEDAMEKYFGGQSP